MKITKSQLKQIIKEELSKVLNEGWEGPGWYIHEHGNIYEGLYESKEEAETALAAKPSYLQDLGIEYYGRDLDDPMLEVGGAPQTPIKNMGRAHSLAKLASLESRVEELRNNGETVPPKLLDSIEQLRAIVGGSGPTGRKEL